MMKSSMSKIETNDVMVGPVVSEGGRSQSTLSPGHGGVGQRGLAPGQRWSVGRKREVVLRLLRGESVELLSRELGVPLYRLEQWRQKADAALDGDGNGDLSDGRPALRCCPGLRGLGRAPLVLLCGPPAAGRGRGGPTSGAA